MEEIGKCHRKKKSQREEGVNLGGLFTDCQSELVKLNLKLKEFLN